MRETERRLPLVLLKFQYDNKTDIKIVRRMYDNAMDALNYFTPHSSAVDFSKLIGQKVDSFIDDWYIDVAGE